MAIPFSISLFATTGDPQGIRHIDKSNWSGFGVVFTRELFAQLAQEPGFSQAGLYILVGNAAEETIYIGEADPVGERLKNHVANKEGWVWGVYFVDRLHKIGKTEVQFLESELVKKAKQLGRAILLNKNVPNPPTMAPAAKATADAFLADMLLILPMLGINAFTPITHPPVSDSTDPVEASYPLDSQSSMVDTLVVPAREEGFQQRFLAENCWFAVRINPEKITKLKYIAAYRVAPIAAITHIAEILSIVPYENTGKYLIRFKSAARAIDPIPRQASSTISMQSPRYAQHQKLLAASHLDQVWSG